MIEVSVWLPGDSPEKPIGFTTVRTAGDIKTEATYLKGKWRCWSLEEGFYPVDVVSFLSRTYEISDPGEMTPEEIVEAIEQAFKQGET